MRRSGRFFNIFLIFTLSLYASLGVSAHTPNSKDASCEAANAGKTDQPSTMVRATTEGVFEHASESKKNAMLAKYIRSGRTERSIQDMMPKDFIVKRIIPANRDHTTSIRKLMTAEEKREYGDNTSAFAIAYLESNGVTDSPFARKLREFGFRSTAKGVQNVGGSGNWTRGGEEIKATCPLNVQDTLGPRDLGRLYEIGQKIDDKTSTPKDLKDLKSIIARSKAHPAAQPPALLKILKKAVISTASSSYGPFHFDTSRHTMRETAEFFRRLPEELDSRKFHADPVIDRKLRRALRNYLAASKAIGETHVHGYGIDYGLIVPNPVRDGLPFTFSEHAPWLSEGAGMFEEHLEATGRAAHLRKNFGTEYIHFENTEVFSPYHEDAFVLERSGYQTSLTTVQRYAEDKGGRLYIVEDETGRQRFVMLEDGQVSLGLRELATEFNTNSHMRRWGLSGAKDLDFEHNKQVKDEIGSRAKINAPDVLRHHPAIIIRGERPSHFVSMKTYAEYIANGTKLVDDQLAEMVAIIKDFPEQFPE